jgi:hypothetical protein
VQRVNPETIKLLFNPTVPDQTIYQLFFNVAQQMTMNITQKAPNQFNAKMGSKSKNILFGDLLSVYLSCDMYLTMENGTKVMTMVYDNPMVPMTSRPRRMTFFNNFYRMVTGTALQRGLLLGSPQRQAQQPSTTAPQYRGPYPPNAGQRRPSYPPAAGQGMSSGPQRGPAYPQQQRRMSQGMVPGYQPASGGGLLNSGGGRRGGGGGGGGESYDQGGREFDQQGGHEHEHHEHEHHEHEHHEFDQGGHEHHEFDQGGHEHHEFDQGGQGFDEGQGWEMHGGDNDGSFGVDGGFGGDGSFMDGGFGGEGMDLNAFGASDMSFDNMGFDTGGMDFGGAFDMSFDVGGGGGEFL